MNERRKFSPEFEARLVLEALSGAKSNAELRREHGLKPRLLSDWMAAFLERAVTVFQGGEQRNAQAAYTQTLEAAGVRVSMSAVGRPEEERVRRAADAHDQEEEVVLSDYRDFDDARSQIERFPDEVYTHKRIHSSPEYLTPAVRRVAAA